MRDDCLLEWETLRGSVYCKYTKVDKWFFNFPYQSVLELIGKLSKDCAKNSLEHKGINFIIDRVKILFPGTCISKNQVKSLKRIFRAYPSIKEIYQFRMPYQSHMILRAIIDIIEDNSENTLVINFFEQYNIDSFRELFMGKHYHELCDSFERVKKVVKNEELSRVKSNQMQRMEELVSNLMGVTDEYNK